MKILVLDDDEYRHRAFGKFLAGHYVVYTWNATGALEALKGSKFDMMFLDHDLQDFNDGVESTGMDVVKGIVALPDDKLPGEVIVHSWNVSEAPRMVNSLVERGIKARHEPFNVSWGKANNGPK